MDQSHRQDRHAAKRHLRRVTDRFRSMITELGGDLDGLSAALEQEIYPSELEARVAALERQAPVVEQALRSIIRAVAMAVGVDLGEDPDPDESGVI